MKKTKSEFPPINVERLVTAVTTVCATWPHTPEGGEAEWFEEQCKTLNSSTELNSALLSLKNESLRQNCDLRSIMFMCFHFGLDAGREYESQTADIWWQKNTTLQEDREVEVFEYRRHRITIYQEAHTIDNPDVKPAFFATAINLETKYPSSRVYDEWAEADQLREYMKLIVDARIAKNEKRAAKKRNLGTLP